MTDALEGDPLEVELFGYAMRLDASRVRETDAELCRQLRAYEAGERESFDLRFEEPEGFTERVWARVREIPYGETRTYGDLARDLGTAPVAVGSANARNPLPVVVPCHRVVGTDSLRGYRYPGLKEVLLRHEGSVASLGFDLDGSV